MIFSSALGPLHFKIQVKETAPLQVMWVSWQWPKRAEP